MLAEIWPFAVYASPRPYAGIIVQSYYAAADRRSDDLLGDFRRGST